MTFYFGLMLFILLLAYTEAWRRNIAANKYMRSWHPPRRQRRKAKAYWSRKGRSSRKDRREQRRDQRREQSVNWRGAAGSVEPLYGYIEVDEVLEEMNAEKRQRAREALGGAAAPGKPYEMEVYSELHIDPEDKKS